MKGAAAMAIGGLVRLTPKAGEEEALRRKALAMAQSVRSEPGNVLAIAFADQDAPRDVLLLQLFADAEAIAAHRIARHTVEDGPLVHALLDRPMAVQPLATIEARSADGDHSAD